MQDIRDSHPEVLAAPFIVLFDILFWCGCKLYQAGKWAYVKLRGLPCCIRRFGERVESETDEEYECYGSEPRFVVRVIYEEEDGKSAEDTPPVTCTDSSAEDTSKVPCNESAAAISSVVCSLHASDDDLSFVDAKLTLLEDDDGQSFHTCADVV